jgi:RHS repeat-associated protein
MDVSQACYSQNRKSKCEIIPQKPTSKERDAETGLGYFGAQCRFTSPDPLLASAKLEDSQTWNRYVYARNNPLRYTDPEGLYPSLQYNCTDDTAACLNDEQPRILENSEVKIGNKNFSGEALWNAVGKQQNGETLKNAFVNLTDRLASVNFGDGTNVLC